MELGKGQKQGRDYTTQKKTNLANTRRVYPTTVTHTYWHNGTKLMYRPYSSYISYRLIFFYVV